MLYQSEQNNYYYYNKEWTTPVHWKICTTTMQYLMNNQVITPICSFEHYLRILNPEFAEFFQKTSKDPKKFEKMCTGENPPT